FKKTLAQSERKTLKELEACGKAIGDVEDPQLVDEIQAARTRVKHAQGLVDTNGAWIVTVYDAVTRPPHIYTSHSDDNDSDAPHNLQPDLHFNHNALLDDVPVDAPFDVAHVPDHLHAEDPYSQDVVDNAILHNTRSNHVEVMSMLERTLNYAHTGSARVLCRKLMLPSFLSLRIIHDGMPSLNKRLLSYPGITSNKVEIDTTWWPRHPSTRHPLMGSKRVQELTYGLAHSQKSEARFVIVDAIQHPHSWSTSGSHVDTNETFFDGITAHVYIEDVKALVSKTVQAELMPVLQARDFATRDIARTRCVALKVWLKCKHPLSYEKEDFPHLLTALDPMRNNNGIAFALEAPPGEGRPVSYFVDKIVGSTQTARTTLHSGRHVPTHPRRCPGHPQRHGLLPPPLNTKTPSSRTF
ncbi:hypothetical protein OG21DRAFT_1528317, partial [Imleria badia]